MTPIEKVKKLEEILTKGKCYSIQELSNALKCDSRSTFRYITRLVNLGLKVESKTRKPSNEREYWIQCDTQDLPVKLIEKLHRLDYDLTLGGTRKYHKVIHEALMHLDPKNAVTHTIATSPEIEPYFHIDHGPLAEFLPSNSRRDQILDRILEAIKNQNVLQIQYHKTGQEELATIQIEPYYISLRVGKLYLLGRIIQSSPNNEFQLNQLVFQRIKMVVKTAQIFKRNSRIQASEFYKYCFGQWVPQENCKPEIIKIKTLAPWVNELLNESNFNPKLQWENKTTATLELYLTPDLENWLFGLLPNIKIMAPLSLKKRIANRVLDVQSHL